MKDPQALPGLSLVQWMNLQQNPSLANSVQPNYMNSFPGSVLQNLAGADTFRQLGFSSPQMPQASSIQFNAHRLPLPAQQLDQLSKVPSLPNPLGSVMQPQQMNEVMQQPRQKMVNQTLPSSQVQTQILQPQTLVQTVNALQQQPSQRNLSQNPQHQQQIMNQNQHQNQNQNLIQNQPPDQINQSFQHMSDNQLQLQLLQKLQQQQQSLLAQQSTLQQLGQPTQVQDQQKQLLDVSQSFSRSVVSSQVQDISQIAKASLPISSATAQQASNTNNSQTNMRFPHVLHQPNFPQQQPSLLAEASRHTGIPPSLASNQFAAPGSSAVIGAAGAGQFGISDDVPSCSTSPSTNNCPNAVQPMMNNITHRNTTMREDVAQSTATILSPIAMETIASKTNLVKDFQQKSEVKPSLHIPQSQGNFTQQAYLNGSAAQTDYLDTSSSTNSVCLSQNDANLQQNNNSLSFNQQAMLFREISQDEVQADLRNNISSGNNVDAQLRVPLDADPLLTKGVMDLGKDFQNNLTSGGMLGSYEHSKDAQQELSSSIVSQSFGVPEMAFNSMDSTINNSSFLNRNSWAPQPQFQRMRTYTKVGVY